MPKNLVIVESPAKAKTIEKFLGKDYKVLSSYGHIRDLKKKDFSVDIDHDFTPIYEIPSDKKRLVENLKEEASKADMVWLASDEDPPHLSCQAARMLSYSMALVRSIGTEPRKNPPYRLPRNYQKCNPQCHRTPESDRPRPCKCTTGTPSTRPYRGI